MRYYFRIFPVALLLLTPFVSIAQKKKTAAANFVANRFHPLPLGSIKPEGWLRNQLQIMRQGTTGHLDEVHAKLANSNGWLGGTGDGWEETPYWLDGAVPLAYLLDDPALKEKVLRYIHWTVDHQRTSGYFGPITKWERETGRSITADSCARGEDWWPKMIMLKVLQQYYTASKDPRVIPFMSRFFAYQLQTISKCTIGRWTGWAASRAADNILIAQWLYGITKDPSLLQLSAMLHHQAYRWTEWFSGRDWVINAAALQNDAAWMTRHGVNVGMAIKDPAVWYQRTGDTSFLRISKTGFKDLMTLHGLPMGIFSADEDLHGNDPVQGSELCAIVESMFSLEQMIGITGDLSYMDALERMAFNALPAQTTDDYNSKQYFQIANQVHIKRGVFQFSLPFERQMNNVLGMRSGYTCCLANMHQGWTKFAAHLWYKNPENGLAALHYSPSTVTTTVGKNATEVTIHETTGYPFSDQVQFRISTKKEVAFPFQLRIPSWCDEALVLLNGNPLQKEKGGRLVTVNRTWKDGDNLVLQLPMKIKTSSWGGNSRAVERGPLVYALKLEEQWERGIQEREGEYFSVYPKGDWNYGLLDSVVRDPNNLQVREVRPVSDTFVWNLAHAPIEIAARAKKIPDWKIVQDVAPQPVTARDGLYMGPVDPAIHRITLVPYGCTKVRIVAFPVVR